MQLVVCEGGQCETACETPFGDCDHDPVNGCEALLTTLENCGVCGLRCRPPHTATSDCASGTCDIATCEVPYADCDRNPGNGCEALLSDDPLNCGRCSNACSAFNDPHADAFCQFGACNVACKVDWADCYNFGNCSVDLRSDLRNCGGCGFHCLDTNHGSAACTNGYCGWNCDPGFTECARDGCYDLQSDASHCGACNQACPPATPSCVKGTCQ
jgi:hypothetical protein